MIILTLYRILWWVFLPVIVLLRLFKDWRSPLGVRHFSSRFGMQKIASSDLLIHAVSLGEVRAVTPLVKRLLTDYPTLRILFTATTLTGSEQIQRSFVKELTAGQLTHTYLPLDFGPSIRTFLHRAKPKSILIMETEIWPNLFKQAEKAQIPVAIISACLSDRSYRRFRKIPKTARFLLQNVDVLAQTDEDVLRFETLGVKSAIRMGNIKYDMTISPEVIEISDLLFETYGARMHRWICASTHDEEEEIVMDAFIELKKSAPDLQLLIAPRHPERFHTVQSLLTEYADAHDFKVDVRSGKSIENLDPAADIWLLDSLGELLVFYAFSDIVTVGGSFVPIGGHNILEPAYFGKPIIVGPHMEENEETLRLFLDNAAIVQTDAEQLAQSVLKFYNDQKAATEFGNAAKRTMLNNQGALSVVLDYLKTTISL